MQRRRGLARGVTKARRPRAGRGVTWPALRRCFLALPGVVESTSYGTPAFKVGSKLLARLREDGENLVVRASFDAREALIAAAPEIFHVTDHYLGYPWVLVRLARVQAAALSQLAEQAWRSAAPKRAVTKWDAERR